MSSSDGEKALTLNYSLKRYGSITANFPDPHTIMWKDVNIFAQPQNRNCSSFFKPNFENERKQILFNVTGIVNPGEILAVMGSSGAGKSTLMNYLAGHGASNITAYGQVIVNGSDIGINMKHISAYVQQDDLFLPLITIKEHLIFQAQLRIGGKIPMSTLISTVDDVIHDMGLRNKENSYIGIQGQKNALSGGERKRLSFATEVLMKPPILFCDEPTSGLDSYVAQTVIQSLKRLTLRGHTIICTIHQPSSQVYELMDKLCLLAAGKVTFFGNTNEVNYFFSNCGYPFPDNYNPADFFMNILAILPDKEKECHDKVAKIVRFYSDSYLADALSEEIQTIMEESIKENGLLKLGENKAKVNVTTQTKLLFKRAWMNMSRNPKITRTRLIQAIIAAFIFGLIFWQQPYNQEGARNLDGAIFLFQVNISFGNVFMIIASFTKDLPIVFREYLSGIYGITPYFFSKAFAELPIFIFIPTIFTLISYFMVGLLLSAKHFLAFLSTMILESIVTMSFGLMCATMLTDIISACSLGTIYVVFSLIFGGLLINLNTLPKFFQFMKYGSWFYFSTEIFISNQWRSVENIECELASIIQMYANTSIDDNSICFTTGNAVITSLGFDSSRVYEDVLGLFILFMVFSGLAFIFLIIRARAKHS